MLPLAQLVGDKLSFGRVGLEVVGMARQLE